MIATTINPVVSIYRIAAETFDNVELNVVLRVETLGDNVIGLSSSDGILLTINEGVDLVDTDEDGPAEVVITRDGEDLASGDARSNDEVLALIASVL